MVRPFTPHLDRKLPSLERSKTKTATNAYEILLIHPAVLALEKYISASQAEIELAEQQYKPQFGLNATYGYRDDAPNGIERTDFVSLGIGFDLPIFTANRQDQEIKAAASNGEYVKTRKWLLLRKLYADFEAADAQLLRLVERQQLYKNRLLPQMREQSEASLNAYTNDVGDFSEVTRSRIAELNARIDYLAINVDKQKTIAQLAYFFAGNDKKLTEDGHE